MLQYPKTCWPKPNPLNSHEYVCEYPPHSLLTTCKRFALAPATTCFDSNQPTPPVHSLDCLPFCRQPLSIAATLGPLLNLRQFSRHFQHLLGPPVLQSEKRAHSGMEVIEKGHYQKYIKEKYNNNFHIAWKPIRWYFICIYIFFGHL